jgi:MoaA/NifB/PqqE/SkfB family radical SAM enzyme
MKAFISGGGIASWKYLPFKHNEDEYDVQKTLAKKIGAKFAVVQPGWFDENRVGEVMKPSKHFPNPKTLTTSKTNSKNPENYCMVVGKGGKLLEISPDGIIYPCCFVAKPLFSIYAPFLNGGDQNPHIDNERVKTDNLYKVFVEDMLPLIENQGGIKTLSLYHNNIKDILKTDIFVSSLKKSWEKPNRFCTELCRARKYIITET